MSARDPNRLCSALLIRYRIDCESRSHIAHTTAAQCLAVLPPWESDAPEGEQEGSVGAGSRLNARPFGLTCLGFQLIGDLFEPLFRGISGKSPRMATNAGRLGQQLSRRFGGIAQRVGMSKGMTTVSKKHRRIGR